MQTANTAIFQAGFVLHLQLVVGFSWENFNFSFYFQLNLSTT